MGGYQTAPPPARRSERATGLPGGDRCPEVAGLVLRAVYVAVRQPQMAWRQWHRLADHQRTRVKLSWPGQCSPPTSWRGSQRGALRQSVVGSLTAQLCRQRYQWVSCIHATLPVTVTHKMNGRTLGFLRVSAHSVPGAGCRCEGAATTGQEHVIGPAPVRRPSVSSRCHRQPSAQPALLPGADAGTKTRRRRRPKSSSTPTFRDHPRQLLLPLGDESAPPERVG
jgi:hypothetical protein